MSKNLTNDSRSVLLLALLLSSGLTVLPQAKPNGPCENIANIFRVTAARSRSISPENSTGAEGGGGTRQKNYPSGPTDPDQGWNESPGVIIKAKTTYTVAEMDGSGSIQHIRMTPTGNWRYSILRFYWDGEKDPSVEVPVGDFFCMGWGQYAPMQSLAVCVNPGNAFNCYWPMPFRKKCRITIENVGDDDISLFYQVDYTLTKVSADAGYFHAQFRRIKPSPDQSEYVLVDNIKGKGQYVGTYLAWGVNCNSWRGEGEIRFCMDDGKKSPSATGFGTENYFCGFYQMEIPDKKQAGMVMTDYVEFSTPYSGLPQILSGKGKEPNSLVHRYGLYRWHIADPIHFKKGIKVTIQPSGWNKASSTQPMPGNDIASTVFWYQLGPHTPYPGLPEKEKLAIN
ncbi:glycoside hydrolase family 172 protein [Flavitalea flava]